MRLLYQFPTCLQRLFGGVVWRGEPVDASGQKTVYLTFDDGPIPEVTPAVLALLDELDVRATFFMVGDNIRRHPDLYRAVLAAGHRVGNHTMHHARAWHLSIPDYLAEVDAFEQQITSISSISSFSSLSGISSFSSLSESPLALSELCSRFGERGRGKGASLFRPPHGQLKSEQLNQIRARGLKVCMWDVLPHDYNPRYSAERMLAIVQRYTRPGSIINWHDSLRSGDRMLEAVRTSIVWLKSQGYSFSLL